MARHRAIVLAEETWIGARALSAWLEAGQEVAEVWCTDGSSLARPVRQPQSLAFPGWSVRRILRRRGIPLRRCPPLRRWPEAAARAAETGGDVLLNLLGLQIIPPALLDRFPGRALNLHPALLPLYRGPCPRLAMLVEGRAAEAGGVTLHLLAEGIDEGPIVGARPVPYAAEQGYAEWCARLAEAAAGLVVDAVLPYLDGRLTAVPQDESRACYRRPAPGLFEIAPATALAHARRLIATLGGIGQLVCRPAVADARRASCHVTRIDRVIGEPTGRPAVVGWRTVELDLADARVRFVRRGPCDRLREQAAVVAALSRPRSRG